MCQPEGFVDNQKHNYVCKLHKSLYRLKQASRARYDKLKNYLLQWDFANTSSNSSLFIRRSSNSLILILIYVDDIVITGPNTTELERFIVQFNTTFALKDLGILSYFLRVEVLYDAGCIYLSQKKYVRDFDGCRSQQK